MKPGDIVKTLSGKTVEVQNTDAEGRLILADALTYAQRYNPAALLDIATLTGACVVALGQFAIGMFGTDDKLKGQVQKSGQKSGERVWEMPLWEEYFEQLRSDVADMRNIGGRGGGMMMRAFASLLPPTGKGMCSPPRMRQRAGALSARRASRRYSSRGNYSGWRLGGRGTGGPRL